MRYQTFGPFVLDRQRGVLLQHGSVVPLTPRVFNLLVTLVTHRDRVVTKDELLALVWQGTIVDENNLPRSVSTLRKALHERPGQREYIATVSGVGYRFVADISETDEPPPGVSTAIVEPTDLPASELAPSDLSAPVEIVSASVVTQPASRHRSGRWIIAGAALTLFAALGLWQIWPRAHTQATSATRAIWKLTSGDAVDREPTWSPDGQSIAYSSDLNGNSDIWVAKVSGGAPVRVTTSTAADSQPDWSPDGRSIVFRSDRDGGGLFVAPVSGGGARRISPFGFRPRWSPSSDRVLFSEGPLDTSSSLRLLTVKAEGGTPVPLPIPSTVHPIGAAWYPDGRRVSILERASSEAAPYTLLTVNLDGSGAAKSRIASGVLDAIANEHLQLGNFSWARSGRYLYFEALSRDVSNLWRITVDPSSLAWIGGPDRLTTGAGSDNDVVVSPDGSRLAFSIASGRTAMWSFPFDETRGRIDGPGEPIAAAAGVQPGADIEPVSKNVVYRTLRGDHQEIWEHSEEGGERLLADAVDWSFSPPHWSPDGQKIVFAKTHGSPTGRGLSMLALGDAHEEFLTTPGTVAAIPMDWSADGSSILAQCDRETGRYVSCLLPVAAAPHAEQAIQILPGPPDADLSGQRFSPNGRWISFIGVPENDGSRSKVYLSGRDGKGWHALTDGKAYDDKARWSPDGRTLYFISNRDGHPNVWARHINPDTGAPVGEVFQVTQFNHASRHLAPSPRQGDLWVIQDRLFVSMTESSSQVWILDRADR